MITTKNKNLIYQFLFGLIFFLVPSNLFFKFLESKAYVNGILIDYLIPKLYLSDLIIFILFIWWIFNNKKVFLKKINKISKKVVLFIKKNKLLFFLFLAIFFRQFNTNYPIAAYWYLFKIVEFIFLGLIFINKKKLITSVFITFSTIFTLLFQSGISIVQFINQSSIAGYLFLGEANLSKQIGLAKQTINGVEKIIPYGTTAHPNILGGIISLYLLSLIAVLLKPKLKKGKYHKQLFIIGPMIISIIALVLTFSLSAWLTFIIGSILILNRSFNKFKIITKKLFIASIGLIVLTPIVLSLLSSTVTFSNNPSITRRAYLNKAAINIFKSNLIWGVGLNNFTSEVEKYSPTREVVRFIQPSHHTLLLILSEVGLLGLVIIILISKIIIKYSYKNKPLIQKNIKWGVILLAIITPILVLDHYLFTNQSGLLLITIIIVLSRNSVFQHQR